MEIYSAQGANESTAQPTIQDKIQKLVDSFASLKEKYATLKEEHEAVLKSNIELDDEKNQWLSEKTHLEQKVLQLSEELKNKDKEINELNEKASEYDSFSKTAAIKIDDLLSKVDFDI